mmetsp:Transcript_3001/g.8963  ORF Transcript_3001/g.8963 Transcript_3001/m.8963 type:complete len:251 (+) Transcript_3001:456-1208(+)
MGNASSAGQGSSESAPSWRPGHVRPAKSTMTSHPHHSHHIIAAAGSAIDTISTQPAAAVRQAHRGQQPSGTARGASRASKSAQDASATVRARGAPSKPRPRRSMKSQQLKIAIEAAARETPVVSHGALTATSRSVSVRPTVMHGSAGIRLTANLATSAATCAGWPRAVSAGPAEAKASEMGTRSARSTSRLRCTTSPTRRELPAPNACAASGAHAPPKPQIMDMPTTLQNMIPMPAPARASASLTKGRRM